MIKLHYANLNLGIGDIPALSFPSLEALKFWSLDEFAGSEATKRVFLFTWGGEKEDIFISEYSDMIHKVLSNELFLLDFSKIDTFYLYEYDSFEDAYQNALDIKEVNPLCYNTKHNSN